MIGYFSDNAPPAAVDKRTMTPGDSADVGDTTPTLHTTYDDPNGDAGYVAYEVYSGANGALVTSGNGPSVGNGADSAWTAPSGTLTAGSTYRWRSRKIDNKGGASDWSPFKYFNTQNASITGEQRRFLFEERTLSDRAELKAQRG